MTLKETNETNNMTKRLRDKRKLKRLKRPREDLYFSTFLLGMKNVSVSAE